jgi:hypothetical protein
MRSVRFPGPGGQPCCPTCHDSGYLPNPFSDTPGDFLPCPACHQEPRWGLADACGDDGADAALVVVFVRFCDPAVN